MKGLRVLVALTWVLLPGTSLADAIIQTRAMSASTIAEYFVEADSVTVELEIGFGDLDAFRNLLPDALYERLGHEPRALTERLADFFTEDFVVEAEPGLPIPARILEMVPRARVRRDEISGEPLPASSDTPEMVLFARLWFPLHKPGTLTLGGQAATHASVGYVVYHRKIAVNDFRYLGASQTLQLDWQDPWYTRFDRRTLRRTYFAPMTGFIYVEPYEVRKEIILRPKDLEHWIDLGIGARETIPIELQTDLKRRVAEFLLERQPVTIDGDTLAPRLAQIHFLERTLKSSRVFDPPLVLDTNAAILGAIFVYPTHGLPERVTMEWDLFNDRIQIVPAATVDQAGGLPTYLEPDSPVLEWRNFLKKPEIPTLAAISAPPGPWARWLGRFRVALLAAGLLVIFASWRWRSGSRLARSVVAGAAVLFTAFSFWWSRDARLSDEHTHEIVAGLLHNIYRAFDFRDEERIYDVLERSIQGELLTQIYLETRRGLELANQGGARAKVRDIELEGLVAEPGGAGFRATATWIVGGSVGHWGHVHTRRNRYHASLRVQPVDGTWKLASLEILEEIRL